mgnify:FL=1
MKTLLLASIAVMTSLTVFAEKEELETHPLDADKDGLISLAEAKKDSTLSAIFSDLDINKDGYLSQEELALKVVEKVS